MATGNGLGRFPLEMVRNIGIIAHIHAGKTTTTERILFYTGRTYKIGDVDEGTSIMNFMEQERARGITIKAAATTCYWQEHRINIIDTPGHVDFTAEVERSLRVLDGGVVVFDAVSGVEAQSETVWRQAVRYQVPRICFINKLDRPGSSYSKTLAMIEDRLKAKALPVYIPLGSEETFKGIIDLVENKAWTFSGEPGVAPEEIPIPEEEKTSVAEYRKKLVERLAEEDDEIMTAYFAEAAIPPATLKAALRRVTLANQAVPILCGASFRNIGMEHLMDAIINYLPSPVDMPPVKGVNPETGSEVSRQTSDDEPFTALAFKVVSDPFVGRLVYLRVYSGSVEVGSPVYNVARDQKERIGRLLRMHANHREEIARVETGDIIATLGLKNTFTGDTLCQQDSPLLLEAISFPDPVVSIAIEPKSRDDQDRLVEALRRLAEEDPTFKVNYNEETGQTIISGMGELHLEVVVSRLVSDFKVSAKVGKPRVAYRETITQTVKAEGRFVRQSGGHGQYGHVLVELAPLPAGKGFVFEDKLRGGTIPRQFIAPVEAGLKEAMQSGVLAGYPLVDIKASLYDGSYHEVDSSDIAFKMAGALALRNGAPKASPVLLEPMMKIEIVTPKDFLGDVISDLSARRGQIEVVVTGGDVSSIHGLVPLAEAFGYATTLRSITQGRGTYTMEFARYERLPEALAEDIIKKTKGGVHA
ncbi:MAG: elongation factor G [Chloroflexota bacterium]